MYEMAVEERVVTLEALMEQVWYTIDRVDHQIERTQRSIEQTERLVERTQHQVDQTSREMRLFKEEMRASHERWKTEMRASREQSEAEMRASRERSEAEMREFRIEMNKKWGELANKMGTMAEDLVAPSVPRILHEAVGCPDGRVDGVAVRVRRLHPADRGRSQEFDVVAVCGEYVLINETKSRLGVHDVDDFALRLPEAHDFFPEYADNKFIGAIASLYVDESVVRYGEKQGLIVLGFGEDVMEVLNSPGFVPRVF